MSHISPQLRNEEWTEDEDNLLLELHAEFGNKWSKMRKYFDGRPPNAIKNRWNCLYRRSKKLSSISSPESGFENIHPTNKPKSKEPEINGIFNIYEEDWLANFSFSPDSMFSTAVV